MQTEQVGRAVRSQVKTVAMVCTGQWVVLVCVCLFWLFFFFVEINITKSVIS